MIGGVLAQIGTAHVRPCQYTGFAGHNARRWLHSLRARHLWFVARCDAPRRNAAGFFGGPVWRAGRLDASCILDR